MSAVQALEDRASPATGAAAPLLSVQNLSVQFATDHGWVTVVDDVSFELHRNQTLGIVGESGSGKSVTAMSVLRLLSMPPARIVAGRILFEGTDLLRMAEGALNRIRGNDIAMIFQEPLTSLNPAFTVGDQVAEVVRQHRDVSRKAAWARAVEMLEGAGDRCREVGSALSCLPRRDADDSAIEQFAGRSMARLAL